MFLPLQQEFYNKSRHASLLEFQSDLRLWSAQNKSAKKTYRDDQGTQ